MNILITGAQFENKGAQSMLFNVVSELRDRYPNAIFYYVPLDFFSKDCFANCNDYRFHFVFDDVAVYDYPVKYGGLINVKRWAENTIVKTRIVKNRYPVAYLSAIWDRIDVMIDISGYSLTSKFGLGSVNRMIRHIESAKKRNIKVILLPQSFGPFDFSENTEKVCARIHSALSTVDLLFAREEDGVVQLQEHCGVTKAVLSPDIVLQAKDIHWSNVFVSEPNRQHLGLKTNKNVGIVPNSETVRNGNHDVILTVYRLLLRELRKNGKEIYIFRHSDDLPLCREIFALVKDDEHCHLIEDEIDCLSYGPFVRQFDFIVASRFHSVVHAYREGVPALVLGWAKKYQELAALMGQEMYVSDITTNQINSDELIEQLNRMISRSSEESEEILSNLSVIQEKSCFDMCSGLLDSFV